MIGRRPHYSEIEIAMARQRSFVGAAFAVFVLYWICYLPGLIFNLMWLSEAGRVRRVAGSAPAGLGCLQAMLVIGFLPLIFFGFILFTPFMTIPLIDPPVERGVRTASGHVEDSVPLDQFVVSNSRVEAMKRAFGEDRIVGFFDFTNESDLTVTSAVFDMEYRTPGRALAWDSGLNEESFRGGIEPGETKTVEFLANPEASMLSLYRLKISEFREDAELIVKVRSVETIKSGSAEPEKQPTDGSSSSISAEEPQSQSTDLDPSPSPVSRGVPIAEPNHSPVPSPTPAPGPEGDQHLEYKVRTGDGRSGTFRVR